MSVEIGPVCGCLGCRDDAAARVDHPDHGPRAVCPDHYPTGAAIIEFVDGGGD